LYRMQFPADGYSRPVSRAVLGELSGATASTQRRWERLGGVKVRGNCTRTGREWDGERLEGPRSLFVRQIQGKREILKRLPNSYGYVDLQQASRRMTRQVNSKLRADRSSCNVEEATLRSGRLFYLDAKRATRKVHTLPDTGNIWLRTSERTHDGLSLWGTGVAVNGEVTWL